MKGFWSSVATLVAVITLSTPGHSIPPRDDSLIDALRKIKLRPDSATPKPQSVHGDRPTVLWLSESHRLPKDVEAAGGFWPEGAVPGKSGAEALTTVQRKMTNSLFDHSRGHIGDFSQYLSAFSKPAVAATQGMNPENPRQLGFLYKITGDYAIDVEKSLGKRVLFPLGEYAFASPVKIEQVMGWYDLSKVQINQLAKLAPGESLEGFHENPRFDGEKYKGTKGVGMQPQLAGFPDGDEMYKKWPWSVFEGQRVEENLRRFREQAYGSAPADTSAIWDDTRQREVKSILKENHETHSGIKKKVSFSDGCTGLGKRDAVDCAELLDQKSAKGDVGKSGDVKGDGAAKKPAGVNIQGPDSSVDELGRARPGAKAAFAELASEHRIDGLKIGSRQLSKEELYVAYSQRLKPRFTSAKAAGAGALVFLPLYVADLISAFSTNTTSLERTAALTSIIPIFGCIKQQEADEQSSLVIDSTNQAMCLLGDILFFTPFMSVGLLLHAVRHLFKQELRFDSVQPAQEARDEAWQRRVQHGYLYIRDSAASQWDSEIAIILKQAADAKAAINSTRALSTQDSDEVVRVDAEKRLNQVVCQRISARHSELRTEIPETLASVFSNEANDFNRLFISRFNATMNKPTLAYLAQLDHAYPDGSDLGKRQTYPSRETDPQMRRLDWQRAQAPVIEKISRHLESHPPPVWDNENIFAAVQGTIDHRWNRSPCQPSAEIRNKAISEEKEFEEKQFRDLKQLACTGEKKVWAAC